MLHESYQILLTEYHAKKAQRIKQARATLKKDKLKALEEEEAAKVQAEKEKMQGDMDKFFDASGSVVS